MCNWFKREKPSPSDIVPRHAITHIKDGGYIHIDLSLLAIPFTKNPKVWTPMIPNTDSMDPVFDEGNNNIFVAGVNKTEQSIMLNWLSLQPPGNIIVYRIPDKAYLNHRIVKVKFDEEGVKYTLKGDNNSGKDPYTVRNHHIEWVSIGVLY